MIKVAGRNFTVEQINRSFFLVGARGRHYILVMDSNNDDLFVVTLTIKGNTNLYYVSRDELLEYLPKEVA